MNAIHRLPNEAAKPTAPPKSALPTRALDVLVVEDNLINQKVVVSLLTKWGHRVVVAGDGALGLREFGRLEFDLVLMDVQMPVMDGIEATCSIRKRELHRGGHTPIIAITAHARIQDQERCIDAGMDRYLTKPLNSELLRNTIAELFPNVAASPDAPKRTEGPVDFERLSGFVGDDPELLAEVVQIFLDDSPVSLENAARAISQADSGALERSAHRLRGSLVTMGANAAAETASLLESLGHGGVLDGAEALCERLRDEVGATRESLRLWTVRERPAA